MIKNYFKITIRSIWKHKLFSAIKIGSLAIGLSASFVIGLMVYYDYTFDKFHKDGERIYRVTTKFSTPDGDFYNPGVTVPLANTLQEDVPGLDAVAHIYATYPTNVRNEGSDRTFKQPDYVIYADQEFFHVFDYIWLAGSKDGVLMAPNELVLSERRAKKYFPDTPVAQTVGETLIYNDSIPLKVAGVVANFKNRTDIIFEEFISLKTAKVMDDTNVFNDPQWNNTSSNSQLFLKMAKNRNPKNLQESLDQIGEVHQDKDAMAYGEQRKFHLQPLSDLHFNPNYYTFDFDSPSSASKSALLSLSCIALFLLLLGCVNFINLNTAQATQRSKEIGVRKTLGSSKKQLVFQFLGETFILTLLAGLLSLLLATWLLDIFSDFIPKGLGLEIFSESPIIALMAIILILATLLSGFYPALVLSRYQPINVLKNNVLGTPHTASLRKYLTVFQFIIAQVFIIGALFVGKQLNYLMTKDMGIKTEALASFHIPWQYNNYFDKKVRLLNEIEAIPAVEKTSLSSHPPTSNSSNSSKVSFFKEGNEIHTELRFLHGDQDYLDLYNIELIAGRKPLNDTIKELVINETYLKILGFNNPGDILGQVLKVGKNSYPIVGVMNDFHQESLKASIEPIAFRGDWYRSNRSRFNLIHFALDPKKPETWANAIAEIEKAWQKIYPDADIEVNFMDDMIRNFYEQERRTAVLLKWATGLSILISCLGLLGLVFYTTERRTKEIGVRKVLGASVSQLTLLLCKEFMKLVGIAFMAAIPIAWYMLRIWLEEFAYKTEISWWVFLLSGLAMLMIAFVVMGARTVNAASRNPTHSLRTE